jgi:hypothetical protein
LRSRRRTTWKYLKILDNTFLFDVVQDPMERANLKERHKDVYDRLAPAGLGAGAALRFAAEAAFVLGFAAILPS